MELFEVIPGNFFVFQLDYFSNGSVNQFMIPNIIWEISLFITFVIIKMIGCMDLELCSQK